MFRGDLNCKFKCRFCSCGDFRSKDSW